MNTYKTRRASLAALEPKGRKAAILDELKRGDGTALEIMRRMGFSDPNAVRPRLNELDRAGFIFRVGKKKDPVTHVEGVVYSLENKKTPASSGTECKGTKENIHCNDTSKGGECQ